MNKMTHKQFMELTCSLWGWGATCKSFMTAADFRAAVKDALEYAGITVEEDGKKEGKS